MRIYFASDIHASERCWRKFLRTPSYYDAQVIIIGGDITGKFLVPIVREDGSSRFHARFAGVPRSGETDAELKRLVGIIEDAGSYAFVTTQSELSWMEEDRARVDALFLKLVLERVQRWIDMAEEALPREGVRCFVSGGNDDFVEIDAYLMRSSAIELPEGRIVDLDGFELLSVGWGNPTPWNCPRDVSEDELAQRIGTLSASLKRPERSIFNLHVPPFGSGLDTAPRLDETMRPVLRPSGDPEMIPVGSTAVRDAIVASGPMLGLHGHIHESRGITTVGRTVCVNPGSEYGEGVLDGALIDIDHDRGVINTELVVG